MNDKKEIIELLNFINSSPTAFHVINNTEQLLSKNGFKALDYSGKWNLEKAGKYYVTRNNSALIAFVIGSQDLVESGFRMIGAHVDAPGLKIKPNPVMREKDYCKLNIEVYGGPILYTWFDRPLALAGRVVLKSSNPFKPVNRLVKIDEPLALIPSLAIHLNRDVNKGYEINNQKDLLPLITIDGEKCSDGLIQELVAGELGVEAEEIVDYELFLYEYEKGRLMGLNKEFISSSGLDDLAMVHAGLEALTNATEGTATRVLVLFDNEEVDSMTKQGAASPMLRNILERVVNNLGYDKNSFFQILSNSFIISADMAHAVHPNHWDKHDPTNKPLLNKGPVIKVSANQRYTSDSDSIAVIREICQQAEIPYQFFVNRSDEKGGSTIGPVSATQLDIRSIDIGNPLLAMHSIRELAGVQDHLDVIKLFQTYYHL